MEGDCERPEWPAISFLGSFTKAYWAQWDSLFLRESVLYHRWESPELGKDTSQLVLHTALHASVLRIPLDIEVGGHLALTKNVGKSSSEIFLDPLSP